MIGRRKLHARKHFWITMTKQLSLTTASEHSKRPASRSISQHQTTSPPTPILHPCVTASISPPATTHSCCLECPWKLAFLVWTRTPAWPEQVSTATSTAFPPFIYHHHPPISVAQKYKGHFYGSNAVTMTKLHATAFMRVRIRLKKL